jgi:hypothetical protein
VDLRGGGVVVRKGGRGVVERGCGRRVLCSAGMVGVGGAGAGAGVRGAGPVVPRLQPRSEVSRQRCTVLGIFLPVTP